MTWVFFIFFLLNASFFFLVQNNLSELCIVLLASYTYILYCDRHMAPGSDDTHCLSHPSWHLLSHGIDRFQLKPETGVHWGWVQCWVKTAVIKPAYSNLQKSYKALLLHAVGWANKKRCWRFNVVCRRNSCSWIPWNLLFRYILFRQKRLRALLWHHNARVNSHQRWKQTWFRVCFHLWCELTSTMNVTEWQVSWNS